MKNIIYTTVSLMMALVMISCEKDEIGGTATEAAAGQWYVTYDGCDANGKVVEGAADYNGGRSLVITYNTSANSSNQMFVDDLGNFLGFKGIATVDLTNLRFSTMGAVTSESKVDKTVSKEFTISDGVIVKNGGVQKNGSVSDSISFFIQYKTDKNAEGDGFVKYHVHGVRYSGLAEND